MKNKKVLFIFIICIVLIGIIVAVNAITNARKDYNLEKILDRNYYTLYKGGKVGVINTSGEIIVSPEYNYIQIPNPTKDIFVCSKNDGSVVLNSKGETIFTEYDEVAAIPVTGAIGDIPFEKSVLKYKQGNMYGLINMEGKIITKAIYEKIESVPYKEGEILVSQNGKLGVVNSKGVNLVEAKYDTIIGDGYYNQIDYKEAGYIVGIKQEDKYLYGYLNNDGKEVLMCEYDEITRLTLTEGKDVYLILSKAGKKGLVKNGETVLDNVYEQIEYDTTIELIKVKQNELYGITNLNGKTILPVEYKDISYIGIYMAATKANQVIHYDKSGKEVKGNIYKKVIATENENYFITVGQNNLYGIIDKNGIETTTNKYTYIDYLVGEYFAAYNEENKIGIIDHYGKIVLGIQYNLIQLIKGTDMIQVSNTEKGTLEIYTSEIKQVATMKNAKLYVYGDYLKMVSDTETMYISLDGRILTNKEALPNNTLFAKSRYGQWGFEDKDGNIVIEQVYDMVTEFNKYGVAGIKEGDKWGIIKEDGTILVEPIYEIPSNTEPEFIGKYYKINYGGEMYFTDEKI